MKKEIEDQLAEEFPFLKRRLNLEEQEATGGISNLFDAFGYECGSGWAPLIFELASEITKLHEQAGIPIELHPAQIKEKWGRLRIYLDFNDRSQTFHAIDIIGLGSVRLDNTDSELHRQIMELVHTYEEKSTKVCEECGDPGQLRVDLPWIQTLCEACYKEKLKRTRKVRVPKKEAI